MAYTLYPDIDAEEAIEMLEELGVFGAVERDKGQLKLYKRKSRRICPVTGLEIEFIPEEQMTKAIRKKLEETGWTILPF